MGSGRVFPLDEDYIKCEAFDIPEHWPQLAGLDFPTDRFRYRCEVFSTLNEFLNLISLFSGKCLGLLCLEQPVAAPGYDPWTAGRSIVQGAGVAQDWR